VRPPGRTTAHQDAGLEVAPPARRLCPHSPGRYCHALDRAWYPLRPRFSCSWRPARCRTRLRPKPLRKPGL